MAIERIAIDIRSNVMQTKGEFAQLERSLKKVTDQIRSLDRVQASLDVALNVRDLAPQLATMALTIGGMGVVAQAVGSLDHGALTSGLSQIDAIASQLVTVAQALGQVEQQVPELGLLAPKLLTMGVAIVSMGAVTVAASYFSGAMGEGLVIVEALCERLLDLAIVIEQIDQRVPDFGQIAPKLATMGIAIVGMGAVTLAANYFSAPMKEGLVIVEALCEQLLDLAIVMEQIDQRVPDFGQVAPKLATMGIAIVGMGAVTLAANYFSAPMKEGLVIVEALCEQLLELATVMEQIDQRVPDFGQVAPKLATMGIAIVGMGVVTVAAAKFAPAMKKGLIIVEQLSRQLLLTAKALAEVDQAIPDNLGLLYGKLASMGVALIGMGALSAALGLVAKVIGPLIAVGAVIQTVLAGNMILISNAIRQVDENVPDNLDNVITKIQGMGRVLAAVSSSTMTSVFGLVRNMAGMLNAAILTQTLQFYVIAAESLQELESVQLNESAIEASIKTIGEALQAVASGSATGAMDLLRNFLGMFNTMILVETVKLYTEAVETLQELESVTLDQAAINESIEIISSSLQEVASGSATGAMDLLRNFLGMFNTAILVETVGLYAEAVETLQSLESVTLNQEAINASIEKIGEALKAVASESTSSLMDVLGNFLGMINTAVLAKTVEMYLEVSRDLQELENVSFNLATVQANIAKIEEAMNSLQRSSGIVGRITQFLSGGGIDTKTAEKAREVFENFVAIAEAIAIIEEAQIRSEVIKSQIQELQETFNVLKDVEGIIERGRIDTRQVERAAEAMENFEKIANAVKAIQDIEIEPTHIKEQIQELQKTFNHLQDVDNIVENGSIDTATIEAARDAMEAFRVIAEAIEAIQEVVIDQTHIQKQIYELKKVVEHLEETNDVISEIEIETDGVDQAATAMGYFRTIAEAVDAIQQVEIKPYLIREQIDELKKVAQYLNNKNDVLSEIDINYEGVQTAATAMGHFRTIAEAIKAIQEIEFNPYEIKAKIDDAIKVINKINGVNFELTVEVDILAHTIDRIDQLKELLESISTLEEIIINQDTITSMIDDADAVLNKIREFVDDAADIGDMDPIQTSINQFKEMARSLAGLSVEFGTVGISFATQLLEGFDGVEVPTNIVNRVTDLLADLRSKFNDFRDVGRDYGQCLKDAFSDTVKNLSMAVSTELTTLESFAMRFTTLGMNFGTNMVTAFETQINRISGIVQRQITNLQTQLSSLRAPSIATGSVQGFATGGLVPVSGLASIFAPMGTDTVPAMLTPGEFVQKKSAVGLFGLDFMRRVNNGDISGAFRAMTSRFNMPFTTTSSVSNAVQNINHTTNNANRITMNTQSVNPDHVMKRISRYF